MDSLDDIKAELKQPGHMAQMLARIGVPAESGRAFCCVLPGHEDKTPSANIHTMPDGVEVYKCFGCGEALDIFALYQRLRGGDFMGALCDVAAMFGKTIPEYHKANGAQGAERAEVARYVQGCAARLLSDAGKPGMDYLRKRGISERTARRFKLGFDPSKGNGGAVIIPYGGWYFARFIEPVTKRDGGELRGLYDAPKGTARPVYDPEGVLENGDDGAAVFVVEGEFDALAIEEAGGSAVAIGGTGGISKFIQAANRSNVRLFVPCMDRDEAGDKAQGKLEREIAAAGCVALDGARDVLLASRENGTFPKDANEALTADGLFVQRVSMARALVQARKGQAQKADGAFGVARNGMLLRRLCDIPPSLPEDEDPNALIKGYALAKGEGWLIAGAPGVGKSSLLMQFAICAAAGRPFFGWEFTRPLRVFYLQTELQMRKLEQSRNSIMRYMQQGGWSGDEIKAAGAGVVFDEFMIGGVSDDLADYLKRAFCAWAFDLLIVDPLLTFVKDDISLIGPTREFLYKEITGLAGGRVASTPDGEPVRFGVIISHHMGKPRYDKGKEIERGQFGALGSVVLNAWPRFILNVSRYAGAVYRMDAAKNPEVAPWRSEDGVFVDTKYIRRAERGERYWIETTKEDADAEKDKDRNGRKAHTPTVDTSQDVPRFVEALNALESGIPKTAARHLAIKLCGNVQKRGNAVYEVVLEDPARYGVTFRRGKGQGGWLGGPAELGVDDSTLDGAEDADGREDDESYLEH